MVMGVGNVLMSDEGLGVHFIKELDNLPDEVEVIEGGTAGLELIPLIEDTEFLIIIDAVNGRAEPGAIFRFQPTDIGFYPEEYAVSFHQVGILEVLTVANFLDRAPKTIIYGVQPKTLEWGLEISPEIQAVFPKLKELVLDEINYILHYNQFRP